MVADGIVLLSSTPSGLQNQIDSLDNSVPILGTDSKFKQNEVIVFRKGDYLTAREKWFHSGDEIELVNSYKYVGYALTTK